MGRLIPQANEAKSKMKHFRYAHAEIRTQMVVMCGTTRYQLDHGGALYNTRSQVVNCIIVASGISLPRIV